MISKLVSLFRRNPEPTEAKETSQELPQCLWHPERPVHDASVHFCTECCFELYY
jgi:hypothetical protein